MAVPITTRSASAASDPATEAIVAASMLTADGWR
jgi:hypothetical protein